MLGVASSLSIRGPRHTHAVRKPAEAAISPCCPLDHPDWPYDFDHTPNPDDY